MDNSETDGRTGGRTLYRYIEPDAYCASSVKKLRELVGLHGAVASMKCTTEFDSV